MQRTFRVGACVFRVREACCAVIYCSVLRCSRTSSLPVCQGTYFDLPALRLGYLMLSVASTLQALGSGRTWPPRLP